jgi:hypothetical protein
VKKLQLLLLVLARRLRLLEDDMMLLGAAVTGTMSDEDGEVI